MYFSSSYEQARQKFRDAAMAHGLTLQSIAHPLRGLQDEELAIDIAQIGDAAASDALVVSSALHGVEGFCGSGAQIALINDAALRERVAAQGVRLVYLHGLNPYGFSWLRRADESNVDLNRNFLDFSKPLPSNPGYAALRDIAVPPMWPPTWQTWLRTAIAAVKVGPKAVQTAISKGQYEDPRGLFYGGIKPSWTNQTLRHLLRTEFSTCKRLVWIDLHSGLGARGAAERILACGPDAESRERARAWWGEQVTSTDEGTAVSAAVSGERWYSIGQECPNVEHTGITMEFGTASVWRVFDALRAELWHHLHRTKGDPGWIAAKQQLKDAFYVDADDWKHAIVNQTRDAVICALDGLKLDGLKRSSSVAS